MFGVGGGGHSEFGTAARIMLTVGSLYQRSPVGAKIVYFYKIEQSIISYYGLNFYGKTMNSSVPEITK